MNGAAEYAGKATFKEYFYFGFLQIRKNFLFAGQR
jgi:hypothetical protein